jgi:predicted nucleic acid-binding protein
VTTESSRKFYIDSSALTKLVVTELESQTLEAFLAADTPDLVTSELASVELHRFAMRRGDEAAVQSREVLLGVAQFPITPEILQHASTIQPRFLRTLDAIHVATALNIGELSGVITYDRRMAEAVRANGLTVFAPGAVDDV